MRLVLVLLAVFLVSADAKLSLGDFFSKLPEKIKKFDITSVVQQIQEQIAPKLPPSIKRFLPLKPEAETTESSGRSPKFCSKYDCPYFYKEKLNVTDYEVRCYPKPYKWVSTNIEGINDKKAFMRLFKYIQGNNEEGMKIKMTVPVTMLMRLGKKSGSVAPEKRTMSFFIPFKHQEDAPVPSASDVRLSIAEPFCAYVKVYGGWSSASKVEENYQSLVAALKRDGLGEDFRTDAFYSASYDEPWKMTKRHNELWLTSIKRTPKASPQLWVPESSSSEPKEDASESSSKEPSSKKSPKFCGDHDCPHFFEKKLNISGRNVTDYTLRCYPKPYQWVSTTVEGMNSRAAGTTAFWRLFRYIQGNNERKMKIKMTVPVTMQMQPSETESDSFCKENYTMSFFIPFKHQTDAPAPSEDDVHLTDTEPFCAYVMVYGGWSNRYMVKKNYKALVAALKRDGLDDDFRTDVFYTAGYDDPMKVENRHNEIWLISKQHNPISALLQSRIFIQ